MALPVTTVEPEWERLWQVVRVALGITKHVDFFRWLQDEVYAYVPHDVLVAAWGDFSRGQLSYDVASNIPEIRTRKLAGDVEMDALMRELYRRWCDGGGRWYTLSGFNLADFRSNGSYAGLAGLETMQSILVYGIRDRRENNDCLYVFFDKAHSIEAQHHTLELLVPQIDAALRRVECLAPVIPEAEGVNRRRIAEMSEREQEIMSWVRIGKTNDEIGLILGISPNTVKNHLKRIFQKLDVTSRAQAVAKYSVIARDGAQH